MSNVTLYPQPDGVPASTRYQVHIDGQPSFVYMSTSPSEAEYTAGHVASWTSFDVAGACTVRIRRASGPISTATVRPRSAGVRPSIEDGEVVLSLNHPCKLAVECDDDLTDALFLFANAPETDIPSRTAADVVWFSPGVHELGDRKSTRLNSSHYS